MKNKSTLVFITLCALVPIIFITVAFFGPGKEVPIPYKDRTLLVSMMKRSPRNMII